MITARDVAFMLIAGFVVGAAIAAIAAIVWFSFYALGWVGPVRVLPLGLLLVVVWVVVILLLYWFDFSLQGID